MTYWETLAVVVALAGGCPSSFPFAFVPLLEAVQGGGEEALEVLGECYVLSCVVQGLGGPGLGFLLRRPAELLPSSLSHQKLPALAAATLSPRSI